MRLRPLRVLTVAALITSSVVAAGGSVAGPAEAHASAAGSLHVGHATLHRCDLGTGGRPAYCGSIQVPLDYGSTKDGTITVGFGWIPARQPGAAGEPRTLVAEEGGPG